MSFNIYLYLLGGILEIEDKIDQGVCYPTFKAIPVSEWDSRRHKGDLEFSKNVGFDSRPDGDDQRSIAKYHRPANFEKAMRWVEENVPEPNRPRLIRALSLMQDDKRLYFKFNKPALIRE